MLYAARNVSINSEMNRTSRMRPASVHVPDLRDTASRRVDDDEPVLIGQPVPLAQVHLLGGPSRRAVHADDERRRLGEIVALGDVEQVFPLLARGDDGTVGTVGLVEDVDRRG